MDKAKIFDVSRSEETDGHFVGEGLACETKKHMQLQGL